MSSILKRFSKKKEKKEKKKRKNVILKEERDRRAKLNFTKDSFKKVQDDAYELRRQFEGQAFSDHKTFLSVFNTENLSERQINSFLEYAQEKPGQYSNDRAVHWLYCDSTEKAALASELRKETRKRLEKSRSLSMLREEMRQGIQSVLAARKRSLGAKNVLVERLGFSDASEDVIDLATRSFEDTKKKRLDVEELLDFVLDNISDLLYYRWDPSSSSKKKWPCIVSVIRTFE